MLIKDLVPSASNSINAEFILLEKGPVTCLRKQRLHMGSEKNEESKQCLTLVADKSACVDFLLWDSECEAFKAGDILRLTNGIFSYHRQKLVLRSGRKGMTEKVGEFTMLFVESPNMSEVKNQKPV